MHDESGRRDWRLGSHTGGGVDSGRGHGCQDREQVAGQQVKLQGQGLGTEVLWERRGGREWGQCLGVGCRVRVDTVGRLAGRSLGGGAATVV